MQAMERYFSKKRSRSSDPDNDAGHRCPPLDVRKDYFGTTLFIICKQVILYFSSDRYVMLSSISN